MLLVPPLLSHTSDATANGYRAASIDVICKFACSPDRAFVVIDTVFSTLAARRRDVRAKDRGRQKWEAPRTVQAAARTATAAGAVPESQRRHHSSTGTAT